MKKIISRLLILVVISIFTAVGASAAPNGGDSQFKEAVLKELNIIDESINAENTVLRGEWAVTLYNIMNYKNGAVAPENGKQIFEDVDQYHYLSGYLEKLHSAGIISGIGNGKFHSDEPIRGIDVYGTLLRVGGYSPYMEGYDEYSDGITAAARIADLKVTKMQEAEITYSELIPILYDALFMNSLEVSYALKDGNLTYSPGGELITEVMGLYYAEGILTGADKDSITDGEGKDGTVSIDGSIYEAELETEDLASSLGLKVICFLNENDVAVAIVEHSADKIVLYSGDIIPSIEDNTYYVDEAGRRKKYALEDGFFVRYNNKTPTKVVNMIPSYGKVELVDNDGDRRYDIVSITDSDILYVKGSNIEKGEIFAEDPDKESRIIKLNDFDEVKMVSQEVEVNADTIQEGTIIAYSESDDGTYAHIEILRDVVSGVVRSNGDEEIRIGEEVYEKASQLYQEKECGIGVQAEITLDFAGKVIYIKQLDAKGKQAIYVMDVIYDDDTQTAIIKAMNERGEIKKYYCAEKVRFDGETTEEHEALAENFWTEVGGRKETIQELVLVELNDDGKIKMIDTADTWESASTKDNSFRTRHFSSMWYKFFGSFKNEVLIDGNTKIFSVPSTPGDDRKYAVKGKGALTNDRSYSFDVYRASDDLVAYEDYIVMKDQNFGSATSGKDILISKITTALNSDDEIVNQIIGIQGANAVTYETDGVYTLSDKSFKPGDIVSVTLDMDGKISNTILQYSYGQDHVENTYPFNDGFRVLGYAHDVLDDTIFIGQASGENADLLYSDSRLKMVAVYDNSEKEARQGSLAEAKTYDIAGGACSKVYVQTVGGEPYFIVIYLE